MINPLDAALAAQRPGRSGSGPRAYGFSGAATNRLTADWMASGVSADSAVRWGMRILRDRGREMVANTGHGARFVGLVEENVIGPHGMTLQARVGEQAGTLNRNVNEELERAHREWSESQYASADRRHDLVEIEKQIARTLPQDGEVIVRMLPGFRNKFGFALQLVDADQLDETFDRPATEDQNAIRMGVEMDAWGGPVAYHILSDHPYDYQRGGLGAKRVRVPADQVCHLYLQNRVGQSRGLTWFTPILLDARMHRGYREAELVAARTAASKMGFFVHKGDQPPTPASGPKGTAEPETMEAAAGIMERLPPGWEFEGWNPEHPNAVFPEFDKAILRTIAAGLRAGYNTLAGDLESVSWSSLRSAELKERDVWQLLQEWLIRNFRRPVYRAWLRSAILAGAVRLPSRNWMEWQEARFRPRGWQWVDPLKDIATAEREIALALNSRTRICAARGIDFEDVLIDLKRERELMEEYGVEIRSEGGKMMVVFSGDDDSDERRDREARVLRLAQGA